MTPTETNLLSRRSPKEENTYAWLTVEDILEGMVPISPGNSELLKDKGTYPRFAVSKNLTTHWQGYHGSNGVAEVWFFFGGGGACKGKRTNLNPHAMH